MYLAGLLLKRKSNTWLMECPFWQIMLDPKEKLLVTFLLLIQLHLTIDDIKDSDEVENLEIGICKFSSEELESQSGL